MRFGILGLVLSAWLVAMAASAQVTSLTHYQACVQTLATTLFKIHNRQEAYQFFLRSIDERQLGSRAYGGRTWLNFSSVKKEIALKLYFNTIYGNSRPSTGYDPSVPLDIRMREATRPSVSTRSGLTQLVVTISYQTKRGATNTLGLAIIVTKQCKVVDVGQGAFASQLMDPNEVDRIYWHRH